MSEPWKRLHRDQLKRDAVLCVCQAFLPGEGFSLEESLNASRKEPMHVKHGYWGGKQNLTRKLALLRNFKSTKEQQHIASVSFLWMPKKDPPAWVLNIIFYSMNSFTGISTPIRNNIYVLHHRAVIQPWKSINLIFNFKSILKPRRLAWPSVRQTKNLPHLFLYQASNPAWAVILLFILFRNISSLDLKAIKGCCF